MDVTVLRQCITGEWGFSETRVFYMVQLSFAIDWNGSVRVERLRVAQSHGDGSGAESHYSRQDA